ncbi:hypothetical protein M9Y10_013139 [Tritrichomonas musculus]|uniref:Uncharacterized protein n=1 Tax=Tritrichomonas musculus TaxID=1915356 RepID=A0ABR2I7G6_9EUKA
MTQSEEEKALTINRAYLLGMHYIQKAVVENIKDPKKVEEFKNKFFDLCDTAKEDIFVASAKPEERVLNLLSEINNERVSLLRYINELKGNDSSNVATIKRLQQYADMSLQTYGQLLTAYNNHQIPPILRKENINIPLISKNFNISSDNCDIKVYNFNPPSSKEKNPQYTLKIYHETSASKTEIYSGNIVRGIICETVYSGLEKFRSDEAKLPRLLRSKFGFEIIAKTGLIKKKDVSLGEQKLLLNSFGSEFTVKQHFTLSSGASFDVEAMIREPFSKPKEKTEKLSIRISTSVTNKVRSATTTMVPEPTVPMVQPSPQPGPGGIRKTTISPKPGNRQISQTSTNVPKPTTGGGARPTTGKAPAAKPLSPAEMNSQQKKERAKQYLISRLPLLSQEELNQFIDTDTIDAYITSYPTYIKDITKAGLEMPDEYMKQLQILKQKKQKLQDDIKSGALSIPDFQELLRKQVARNKSLISKTKNPMLATFYCMSAENMQKQLDSFNDDDDDDDDE